jgi:hypothetical protein
VTATGVRATSGSFIARANADDPITISKRQLADLGITGDRFSLLLPVGMEEVHHTASGRAGLGVSYRTSDGEVRLVELASGGGGVEVTGDGANFLRVYRVRDYLENPVALGEEPLSLDRLRSALERTIDGGVLTVPLRMQIILVDLPIPTVEIADGGVVAMFRVATNASESERDTGKGYPQYPVLREQTSVPGLRERLIPLRPINFMRSSPRKQAWPGLSAAKAGAAPPILIGLLSNRLPCCWLRQ